MRLTRHSQLERSPLDPQRTGEGPDLVPDPQEVADNLGLKLVTPLLNEIFIDIDTPDGLSYYRMALDTLQLNDVGLQEVRCTPSKTPGHFHVVVAADCILEPLERMLLQAILGSDIKRELWSYLRLKQGYPTPTALFEAPDVPASWIEPEIPF